MKKIIVLSLIAFTSCSVMGQILSEHSTSYSGNWAEIEDEGSMFYTMDVPGEQCRIYNSDYQLWKTINVNIPKDNWLTDIQFVSKYLFDSDDEVEILIVYYEYVQTSNSYYYKYTTQVINENGAVLLNVPLGSYSFVYNTTNDGAKLMVYETDYSTYPYPVTTHIYSIPGTWLGVGSDLQAGQDASRVFPNPTNGSFNLTYTIPGQPRESWFIMYDIEGNEILREPLRPEGDNKKISRPDLASGQYHYRIITPNYQTKGQKIIISK